MDAHSEMVAATTVDDHIISDLWGKTWPLGSLVVGPAGLATRGLARSIDIVAKARTWLKRIFRRG